MRICSLDQILDHAGVCALVGGEQVAVFRVGASVYAVGNHDPFSGANVISRGIVGDVGGEPVVASPVYKQHFSLLSGRCIEDPAVKLPVYAARVERGAVLVEPASEVATTCCYCGVGCGVIVKRDRDGVLSVRGDPRHPANFGELCTKGAALHLTTDRAARLLYPEVAGNRASWDEALGVAAARFRECIGKHGPDSVAFYVSGQLLTEDYYVFNKLAKGLIGTNNIDTNSRLCMSSAVAGYKRSLGVDAPPCCYEDIDAADVILIAGSNTAFAHPVLYRRIEKSAARRIVVDPRATLTARAADLHLAIRPGSDVALFNAMLHVIVQEGLVDLACIDRHTEGFDGLSFADWTPQRAARVCDVAASAIVKAACLFGSARAALSLYCQGLNQSTSGTAKNCALINLHLATGQIGRPGAGPFSLTGQPNAMGGREVGGMANLLSAHRELANADDRREIAALWGVEEVPAKPGKTAVELFEAVAKGEIKAVWIAGTNPAQSMPDAQAVRQALQRADFVVVQEAFAGAETCDYADVLLPAASWAEKEGTVTNSERRISRVRAAVAPPGEARPDWWIAAEFARRLFPQKADRLFPYASPEEVFNEHRETTRGRDLDITWLSYESLEREGPQQWGGKRLYENRVFPTPSGRARFVRTDYAPPAEEPDAGYPLRLTTGRLRDQWHTMTRTGLVPRLFSHSPDPAVDLHPADLEAMGIGEEALVRVASRRGTTIVKARACADLRRGEAFIAMHWGAPFLSGCGANALTMPAVDPLSKQPELKHAAVRVERFTPQWRAQGLVAAGDAAAFARFMQRFEYAAASRGEEGLWVDLAASRVPDAADLQRLEGFLTQRGTRGGRAVCACFGVSEGEILSAAAAGATLAGLKDRLKCGTGCGSCEPELRRLVASGGAVEMPHARLA
jgi:assimilatory nitrate reductase catalytic subunit